MAVFNNPTLCARLSGAGKGSSAAASSDKNTWPRTQLQRFMNPELPEVFRPVCVCVCMRVIERKESLHTDGDFVAPSKLIARASRKTCCVFFRHVWPRTANELLKEAPAMAVNLAARVVTELHTPPAAGFTPAVQLFSHGARNSCVPAHQTA